jgi:hypothetical protein
MLVTIVYLTHFLNFMLLFDNLELIKILFFNDNGW